MILCEESSFIIISFETTRRLIVTYTQFVGRTRDAVNRKDYRTLFRSFCQYHSTICYNTTYFQDRIYRYIGEQEFLVVVSSFGILASILQLQHRTLRWSTHPLLIDCFFASFPPFFFRIITVQFWFHLLVWVFILRSERTLLLSVS